MHFFILDFLERNFCRLRCFMAVLLRYPKTNPFRVYVTSFFIPFTSKSRFTPASLKSIFCRGWNCLYIPVRWLGRIVSIGATFLSQWIGWIVVSHGTRGLLARRLTNSACDWNYWNLLELQRSLCLLRRCLHQMRHFSMLGLNYFTWTRSSKHTHTHTSL